MSILSREQILAHDPPLVRGPGFNAEEQVQPNGVDLRVERVALFGATGAIFCSGKVLPVHPSLDFAPQRGEPKPTPFMGYAPDGKENTWLLAPRAYLLTFLDELHLPDDLVGELRARSTLLRCGATLHSGWWDAGYEGRGQSLLVVHNPNGIFLQYGARVAQMAFHRLETATEEGYDGSYQGQGLDEAQ